MHIESLSCKKIKFSLLRFIQIRFLFLLTVLCILFLSVVLGAAVLSGYRSGAVVRVECNAPYKLYAFRNNKLINGVCLSGKNEYFLPYNCSDWRIYPLSGNVDELKNIKVCDQSTDIPFPVVELSSRDKAEDIYLQIIPPEITEIICSQMQSVTRHPFLLIIFGCGIVLFAGYLSARISSCRDKSICCHREIVDEMLSVFSAVVVYCFFVYTCRFAGNSVAAALLLTFTLPLFYISARLINKYSQTFLGKNNAFVKYLSLAAFVAVVLGFMYTRSEGFLQYCDKINPNVDYRSDFAISLACVNSGKLRQMKILPQAAEVTNFIRGKRSILPGKYINDGEKSNILKIIDGKSQCWGKRIYLFWITAGLWKVFGISWIVFEMLFYVIGVLGFIAFQAALFSFAGRYAALLGGIAAVFLPYEVYFMYCNTRNFSPGVAGALVLCVVFCGLRYLHNHKKLHIRSVLFYLIAFSIGASIAWWCAWRSDCKQFLIFAPLISWAFVADLLKRDLRPKILLLLTVGIIVGFISVIGVNAFLGKNFFDSTGQFHTAVCGERIRANLTGISQNCSAHFLDSYQMDIVRFISDGQYGYYTTPEAYDEVCFGLYCKAMATHISNYAPHIPSWMLEVIKTIFQEEKILLLLLFMGLSGCILGCGSNIFSRLSILLSLMGMMMILFLVLPMEKHYVTLYYWLLFAGASGLMFLITLPGNIQKKIDFLLLFVPTGLIFICALIFYSVAVGINSYARKQVQMQLSQMSTINDNSNIKQNWLTSGIYQVIIPPDFSSKHTALRLSVKDVSEQTQIYVVQESVSGKIKSWQNAAYGGFQILKPRKDCDLVCVFPTDRTFSIYPQKITVIVNYGCLEQSAVLYNAENFSWYPVFAAFLEKSDIFWGDSIGIISLPQNSFIRNHAFFTDAPTEIIPYERGMYLPEVEKNINIIK